MAMFPCPRRIVTGHDEDGTAVVLQDGPIASVPIMRGVHFTVLWETNEVPASNDGSEDPIAKKTTDLVNKNGVILRVVDLPAHTEKKACSLRCVESEYIADACRICSSTGRNPWTMAFCSKEKRYGMSCSVWKAFLSLV